MGLSKKIFITMKTWIQNLSRVYYLIFYILSKNNMHMAMIFEIRGCCSCKFTWKKFDMSIKNVMLNLMVMGVVFNPLTLRSNL